MKNFVACLTLLFVLSSPLSPVLADEMPPHFVIDNIVSMSGGNDSVYVKPFDDTNSEFDLPEQDDSSQNEFKHTVTIVAQKWSDKPAKNSRPTAKNGLLNSGSPVNIVAYGNKAVFKRYGGDGFYTVRIHDSKGKVLHEVKEKMNEFVFDLDSMPKTFYVSFETKHTLYSHTPSIGLGPLSIPLGGGVKAEKSEYCYVQLSMEAGRERRLYEGSAKANQEVLDMVKNMILNWTLVKKHNLSNPGELTTKLTEQQLSSSMNEIVRKDPYEFSIARSIAESYVKEHGIKNITQAVEIKESDYRSMSEEYITRLNLKGKAPVKKAPARKKRK